MSYLEYVVIHCHDRGYLLVNKTATIYSFWFKQTGYRLLKGEREYKIARQFQHTQARKAGINYSGKSNGNNYSD